MSRKEFLMNIIFSTLLVLAVFVILFSFFHDNILSPTYILNGDIKSSLGEGDRYLVKRLMEEGIIQTRQDFVGILTNYYSNIISILIAFIGFFAVIQFGFIINQSKESAKKEAKDVSSSFLKEFESTLQQRAEDISFEKASKVFNKEKVKSIQDDLNDLKSTVDSLTEAVRKITPDPESEPENDDEEIELDDENDRG